MKLSETFTAKVWAQESAGAWYFVTLPKDLAQRVRKLTTGLRRPFGSFHVTARTGRTPWETSLFVDTKSGSFVLPIKADVRKREKIALGNSIEVEITMDLS